MFWILLAFGGAAGALARYALAGWIQQRVDSWFPWGTMAVNVLGSFLLGIVLMTLDTGPLSAQLAALLAIGFLGDFTTFSSFTYEAVILGRSGRRLRALLYVFGTTGLAIAGVALGMTIGAVLR